MCYSTSATVISPRLWAGAAFPASTVSQPAEKYVSMLYGHDQIDSAIQSLELDTFTDKKWAALAHYRQATLAQTPYYQVLSYWKILELYFNGVSTDIDTYINDFYSSRPDIFHALGTFTGTAANKLRSIRNASAHFMIRGDTTIQDPDNPDVYNTVSLGLLTLRRLVEGLINRTVDW